MKTVVVPTTASTAPTESVSEMPKARMAFTEICWKRSRRLSGSRKWGTVKPKMRSKAKMTAAMGPICLLILALLRAREPGHDFLRREIPGWRHLQDLSVPVNPDAVRHV